MRKILETLNEAFTWIWRVLDQARRLVVNLLFLVLVLVLMSWLLASDKPEVPDSTALVVDPGLSFSFPLAVPWPFFSFPMTSPAVVTV